MIFGSVKSVVLDFNQIKYKDFTGANPFSNGLCVPINPIVLSAAARRHCLLYFTVNEVNLKQGQLVKLNN